MYVFDIIISLYINMQEIYAYAIGFNLYDKEVTTNTL